MTPTITTETINNTPVTHRPNGVIPKPLPDQELLLRILRYDADTGKLYHLPRTADLFGGRQDICTAWNKRLAGKEAFADIDASSRYLRGSIFNKRYQAQRVIWKMVYGHDPEQIDHINGIKTDNRLVNLRSVTNVENCRNRRLSKINKSGTYGVAYIANRQCWSATIWVNEKPIHIGYYDDKQHAVIARKAAEKVLKFSERHGEITHAVDDGQRVEIAITGEV